MKVLVTFVALLCLTEITGCSILNHDERKYIARIEESQMTIHLQPSQFDTCWNRAKQFVTPYSSRPIHEMNDSVISSDNPSFFELMFESGYGYKVSANHTRDSSNIGIRVDCESWIFNGSSAGRNGYILIDYMKTGLLPYPELVSK
jgi:hypothetical protein